LQQGPGLDQVDALRGRFAVTVAQGELDGEGGAFVDTAALMKCLDLVVCVDTAAGHLAGALGGPGVAGVVSGIGEVLSTIASKQFRLLARGSVSVHAGLTRNGGGRDSDIDFPC
jgi:hypothetical protein